MIKDDSIQTLQDDEIDLRELFGVIKESFWAIMMVAFVITLGSIGWVLAQPNIYESKAVLVSQSDSKSSSLGGLSALAGMAGINLNDGAGLQPADAYQLCIDDYAWMKNFLVSQHLFEKILDDKRDQNFHFALGFDTFYRLKKGESSLVQLNEEEKERALFALYQTVKANLQVSSDKKSSAITISYSDPDPMLAKQVVELFLKQASSTLRTNDLMSLEKQVSYYGVEIAKTSDFTLKTQLNQLMSALIQKKVLMQSSDYYNVKLVTPPSVAYVQDKKGPKRGLIVVVACVTSVILAIFGVFMRRFILSTKEKNVPLYK